MTELRKEHSRRMFISIAVWMGVLLLGGGISALSLQKKGTFERLLIRRAFDKTGIDVTHGANWLINLEGLWGTMPVFAAFTTPLGLRYFATVEHVSSASVPDGLQTWSSEDAPEEKPFQYDWSGPSPPKTHSRLLQVYYALEDRPYMMEITLWFDSREPPATDEEILRDLGTFLMQYEHNL
jgi:hypothetical protein